jgi:hypothetical protein
MHVNEAFSTFTVDLSEVEPAHDAGSTVMSQCKLTQVRIPLILGLLNESSCAFGNLLRFTVEQFELNAVGSLAPVMDFDGVTFISGFRDPKAFAKIESTDGGNRFVLTSLAVLTREEITFRHPAIAGRKVTSYAITVSARRGRFRSSQFTQFDCGFDEGRIIRNLHCFTRRPPSVTTLHDDCLHAHRSMDTTANPLLLRSIWRSS